MTKQQTITLSSGREKLAGVFGWTWARSTAGVDIMLGDRVVEEARIHGIKFHCGTIWRALRGFGLTLKNGASGLWTERMDVVGPRQIWIATRQLFGRRHLHRLGFLDEVCVETDMVKTYGRMKIG